MSRIIVIAWLFIFSWSELRAAHQDSSSSEPNTETDAAECTSGFPEEIVLAGGTGTSGREVQETKIVVRPEHLSCIRILEKENALTIQSNYQLKGNLSLQQELAQFKESSVSSVQGLKRAADELFSAWGLRPFGTSELVDPKKADEKWREVLNGCRDLIQEEIEKPFDKYVQQAFQSGWSEDNPYQSSPAARGIIEAADRLRRARGISHFDDLEMKLLNEKLINIEKLRPALEATLWARHEIPLTHDQFRHIEKLRDDYVEEFMVNYLKKNFPYENDGVNLPQDLKNGYYWVLAKKDAREKGIRQWESENPGMKISPLQKKYYNSEYDIAHMKEIVESAGEQLSPEKRRANYIRALQNLKSAEEGAIASFDGSFRNRYTGNSYRQLSDFQKEKNESSERVRKQFEVAVGQLGSVLSGMSCAQLEGALKNASSSP